MWKMASHTKIVPQQKLYNYLAEQSTVIGESLIEEGITPPSASKVCSPDKMPATFPIVEDNSIDAHK